MKNIENSNIISNKARTSLECPMKILSQQSICHQTQKREWKNWEREACLIIG
jgi:hypothetical protein